MFGTGGSRTGVYDGSIGSFSSLFYLYSQGGGFLPSSGSGTIASPLVIEGVVGGSNLGALGGNATLSVDTGPSGPFNFSAPGQISLTASGNYFTVGGGSVQNNTTTPYFMNVSSFPPPAPGSPPGTPQGQAPTQPLTTGTLYSFSQTYNGFRLGTALATPTLASVEGYGWGLRTSTGSTLLPSNYTGYFVAQDLGTRASATPLSTNWAGVTALTMTGTVSGAAGQTLSGQMTFNGTSQNGTTFNYSGQVSLGTDGRLLYNYYGNWVNGTQTGTGSGNLVQVPGTYFTETVGGSYQQTSTTGTPNTTTVVNTTPLTGTRTDAGSTIATTASMGVGVGTTQAQTYSNGSGSTGVYVEGVVAGPAWDTRWGVASVKAQYSAPTPDNGRTTTGVVTIDTAGTLTGQFVSQIKNPDLSQDNIARNLVSVTQASGLTTSSFAQTSAGTINVTPVSGTNGTQATITNPIPLTGTSAGTISGQINTNLAITSTAMQPSTYNNVISPTIIATTVGAVGGPAGGVQTGVATIQTVTTTTPPATTTTGNLVGTATFQPATASAPATLTTKVIGVNPVGVVPAVQTGTVTVTKTP